MLKCGVCAAHKGRALRFTHQSDWHLHGAGAACSRSHGVAPDNGHKGFDSTWPLRGRTYNVRRTLRRFISTAIFEFETEKPTSMTGTSQVDIVAVATSTVLLLFPVPLQLFMGFLPSSPYTSRQRIMQHNTTCKWMKNVISFGVFNSRSFFLDAAAHAGIREELPVQTVWWSQLIFRIKAQVPAMVREHTLRIIQFFSNPARIGRPKRENENLRNASAGRGRSVASIRKLACVHFWCHQDPNSGVKVSFCLPGCMN